MGVFSTWREWRERRAILQDIRRQQGDKAEWNRFRLRDDLVDALAALELNDQRKATSIWTDVLQRFPKEILEQPLALDVLLKLRRYDEAEALMRRGQKMHPADPHFARGLASVAFERGDYDAALTHYAALRKRFPGISQGYTLGAQALRAKGRLEDADALCQLAMKRFPDEIAGFLEHARLAVLQEDWAEAMRRWQVIQDTFKDRIFGPLGRAQALIRLGRYDEADEVITAARVRFPTESGLLAESARCAEARGDIPEAVKRWKLRIDRAPMEPYGYYEAARTLEGMGEHAEAEAILRTAVVRFPREESPMITLAKLLHERGDYAGEAAAWATLREVFASNEESYTRGADALRRAGMSHQANEILEQYKDRFAH